MKENEFFQQGSRGCLISLVSILLAVCAMAVSANYQYFEAPSCKGMSGAGFPILFICDDWGGSSPTGSWGKIDYVDVFNGGIRPEGFLVDFMFYSVLIWVILIVAARVFHKGIHHRDLWRAAFISMVFITGFLCAFLTFQSSDLYSRDAHIGTSTPVVPSPTALSF